MRNTVQNGLEAKFEFMKQYGEILKRQPIDKRRTNVQIRGDWSPLITQNIIIYLQNGQQIK